MPAFSLLFLHSNYSNYFAGEVYVSLNATAPNYKDIRKDLTKIVKINTNELYRITALSEINLLQCIANCTKSKPLGWKHAQV